MALVFATSTANAADKLTIINSGSKTGGFSMQSTAYSQMNGVYWTVSCLYLYVTTVSFFLDLVNAINHA